MKRWILCLSLLFACLVPVCSHAEPDLTQRSSWPYIALDTMERDGVVVGYPDGTYGGWRHMTRYQFTIAVARTLAQLPREPSSPQTDIGGRLQKAPLALNAFLALVDEFTPELNRIAPPDDATSVSIYRSLAVVQGWQEQAWRDVWSGKIVLTPEQLRNPFAEIAHTAASWQEADIVQKAGIVMGDPNGTFVGSRPWLTRIQMAQSLVRVLEEKQNTADFGQRLRQDQSALDAMESLVTEFTPELKLLRKETDAYQSRLASLAKNAPRPLAAKPFPDVPAGHWAAASVETLRQNGIIAGYPGGVYAQ